MKKIFCLMLALALALALCACGDDEYVETTSAQTTSPVEKHINVEENVLRYCTGQADENGVYVVPSDITEIGELCFMNDTTLKKVVIPTSVTTISSGAFAGCTALETVEMTDSVEVIGSHAFYGCASLEHIALSGNVKIIPAFCFNGCNSLETFVIPEGVTKVEHDAFNSCIALDDLTFPTTLKEIDEAAFSYCISLDAIDLAHVTSLETLNASAFNGCYAAKKVVLPEGLITIGDNCFANCTSVTSVTVPSTVRSIGMTALNHTAWFTENDSDYLIVGDGVLLKCGVNYKSIDLSGKGIKAIGGTAFWNDKQDLGLAESTFGYRYADKLTSIVIPEGVTRIEAGAFYGCLALESVSLPSTLEYVGDSAFYCAYEQNDPPLYAPAKVDFSKCTKLSYIGTSAFYGCSATDEIVLPSTITHVGNNAFTMTKSYVDFYNAAEEAASGECEFKIVGGVLLWTYVPVGTTYITIPDGIRVIGGGACGGWNQVVVVTSPEGLTPYWKTKYNITNSVTGVSIPDGVEIICDEAFYYLGKVTNLTVPSSVRIVGDRAFGRLENLTTITLSSSLESIGDYAFWMCTKLSTVTLPASLKSIGDAAFYDCASLSALVLPIGMENVGKTLFSRSCTEMKHLTVSRTFKYRLYDIFEVPVEMTVSYYK